MELRIVGSALPPTLIRGKLEKSPQIGKAIQLALLIAAGCASNAQAGSRSNRGQHLHGKYAGFGQYPGVVGDV